MQNGRIWSIWKTRRVYNIWILAAGRREKQQLEGDVSLSPFMAPAGGYDTLQDTLLLSSKTSICTSPGRHILSWKLREAGGKYPLTCFLTYSVNRISA